MAAASPSAPRPRRVPKSSSGCTCIAAGQHASPAPLTLLERKRLEMARALATKPAPAAARRDRRRPDRGRMPRTGRDHPGRSMPRGMTIIWIEHIVHALLAVVGRLRRPEFRQEDRRGRAARGHGVAGGAADSIIGLGGMTVPLLETRGLTALYGDFQALFGIDTAIDAGRDHRHHRRQRRRQVILLKAIAGLVRAEPGSVLLRGQADRRAAAPPMCSSSASPWCRRGGGCSPR